MRLRGIPRRPSRRGPAHQRQDLVPFERTGEEPRGVDLAVVIDHPPRHPRRMAARVRSRTRPIKRGMSSGCSRFGPAAICPLDQSRGVVGRPRISGFLSQRETARLCIVAHGDEGTTGMPGRGFPPWIHSSLPSVSRTAAARFPFFIEEQAVTGTLGLYPVRDEPLNPLLGVVGKIQACRPKPGDLPEDRLREAPPRRSPRISLLDPQRYSRLTGVWTSCSLNPGPRGCLWHESTARYRRVDMGRSLLTMKRMVVPGCTLSLSE